MKPRAFVVFVAAFLVVACQSEPGSVSPVQSPEATKGKPTATTSLVGRPLKGSSEAVYRLMEDGRLRHISDWATYLALGYQPENIVQVSDEKLAELPLGLPLTRWLVGSQSPLYFLEEGQRYRVPDLETMIAMGGTLPEVSPVTDAFLNSFKPAADPLPSATLSDDARSHPRPTAVLWADGFLWTANETGLLTRWDMNALGYQKYWLPGRPVIRALTGDGGAVYAGTDTGDVWRIQSDGVQTQVVAGRSGWVSALAVDRDKGLWYADINHFDGLGFKYHLGRGLIRLTPDSKEQVYRFAGDGDETHEPLKSVTALSFGPGKDTLWVATRFTGLLRFDLNTGSWQRYTAFNSAILDNAVADLEPAPDGTLWLATPSGVSAYQNGTWESQRLAEGLTEKGALSLAIAPNGAIWVAGDGYIAQRKKRGDPWQVYTALDHPLLADRFDFLVLDDKGLPWFIGRRYKIYFDGQSWTAYGVDVRRSTRFTPEQPPVENQPPLDFPPPREDYAAWLGAWPRPENDNGRGMHFLRTHQFDEFETQKQVDRMRLLGVRWTLVNYANRYQLARSEPIFRQAGIMVVWRPFVRPYERYDSWANDVKFLRSRGVPPYVQLYNEPSLAQEWDAHPIDRELFLSNLLPAVRQVYDAGGYVGLQFLDPDWLRLTLRRMKERGMEDVFDRLFFVPHPYGLNHPPEYDEDINGVLGFREFAKVFEEEIGFVPVMIAGEGGWRPGERQDSRYPTIDESLHRDYHLAVFDWFRTGRLSNGELLPDYLFAFCPWLISDPQDPAAWFDSDSGDRTLTVEAVKAMPSFRRKFSWE